MQANPSRSMCVLVQLGHSFFSCWRIELFTILMILSRTITCSVCGWVSVCECVGECVGVCVSVCVCVCECRSITHEKLRTILTVLVKPNKHFEF